MASARRMAWLLAAGAFALGLLPVPDAASAAHRKSAYDFVARIYALHGGPNEGFALDADDDFRRYFEPALASRMIRDAHNAWEKRNRARLDHDVFVDAASWLLTRVNVAVASAAPRRAVATVTFDKGEAGWKVASSALRVEGDAPGMSATDFKALAEDAKENCPISQALKGNVALSVEASLVG